MFIFFVMEFWHQLSAHYVIPDMGHVLDCMMYMLDVMGCMLADEISVESTVKV